MLGVSFSPHRVFRLHRDTTGPDWPNLAWTGFGPKHMEIDPKYGAPSMDRIHQGDTRAAFLPCVVSFSTGLGVRWPNLALFGSRLHHEARNQKMAVCWARPTDLRFKGQHFPEQTPSVQNGLNTPLDPVFGPRATRYALSWVVQDRVCTSKSIRNRSQMIFFKKGDSGPLGGTQHMVLAYFKTHFGCFDTTYHL